MARWKYCTANPVLSSVFVSSSMCLPLRYFVDRGTTLPSGSFQNVSMTLEISNDSGTGSATLVQKPAGSGRWRVP
jgi:hypothetical protein